MSNNEMRPEHEFSDDERRLYDLMSEISEDCYFAGWMAGNEHALWDAITTGDLRYGQGDMDRELLAQVAALSVKTGRWIIWRDDHDGLDPHDISEWGPYSITIAEWLARHSIPQGEEPAKGAAQGDELPPLLTDGRIVTLACEEFVNPFDGADVIDFAKAIMREYGAACRSGAAKGEDERDAVRLDWLEHMANQPGGLLLHEGKNGTGRTGLGLKNLGRTLREAVDYCMGTKIDAALTAPEGKG